MPLIIESVSSATGYANPIVGGLDHVAQVKIDISVFTTDEIDADGYLKPGVPIALLANGLGARVGIEAGAGSATSAAFAGNTGTGTMGTVTVSDGAKAGAHKLIIIEPASNAGAFAVYDPDGVLIGTGNVGSAFSGGGLSFTLADGTDFIAGDGFTITVTLTAGGATTKYPYGVTFEGVKLPLATLPPTNTTLASETGDCMVAVCTHGVINRDVAEDNLGRAYTAAELAGFNLPGSHLRLTTT